MRKDLKLQHMSLQLIPRSPLEYWHMKPTLFTLAFPELDDRDRRWIEAVRETHDPAMARRVAPHFTLVFGCNGVPVVDYLDHVSAIAAASSVFPFQCHRITMGHDHRGPIGYAFLVPDQGRSAFVRLHERLHSGSLHAFRSPDIAYVPHLTLARADTSAAVRPVVEKLNHGLQPIAGRIRAISVVAENSRRVDIIRTFRLPPTD